MERIQDGHAAVRATRAVALLLSGEASAERATIGKSQPALIMTDPTVSAANENSSSAPTRSAHRPQLQRLVRLELTAREHARRRLHELLQPIPQRRVAPAAALFVYMFLICSPPPPPPSCLAKSRSVGEQTHTRARNTKPPRNARRQAPPTPPKKRTRAPRRGCPAGRGGSRGCVPK
jgi:hypothetical protein